VKLNKAILRGKNITKWSYFTPINAKSSFWRD